MLDPEELPGAAAAAERLLAAVNARRKIVIYGDYDVDGMTGTALLWLCLRLLSAEVSYYVPNRLDEGYGLNAAALATLRERGAEVIVTVDCGIASLEEAARARELGLELIVTDHHSLAAELPAAAEIVHPALPGSRYPFVGLCGAAVAFKLAWALCQRASQSKRVGEPMKNFLLDAVGLVALGTVADMVPLVGENRIFVRHGLVSLKARPSIGLGALMKLTGLNQKSALASEDVAFAIGPRLNAAGRLGQAMLGVELLVTASAERGQALAEYLHELNGSRDSLERSVYLAARKQAQDEFDVAGDPALVLASRGWHAGVIGIVAGRLAEKFHRPVVLIALDELGIKPAVGSARGIAGLDLHAALSECGEHLVAHGGHAAAAGLKIAEDRVAGFRAAFCEAVSTSLGGQARIAELAIDAEVPLSALSLEAVGELERLAPFGQGNARPLLCASDVTLAEPPRRIGGGERHLALRLVQHGVALRGVAFGGGEWAEELGGHAGPIDIAFRPVINEFRGRRNVELQVCDWRTAAAAAAGADRAAAVVH